MNCANHPEVTVTAYCRTCGKALCERCERAIRGVIYCEDCVAHSMQGAAAPRAAATCAQHPDVAASSYCRTCGRGLCRECERGVRGVVYCEDCLASRVAGPSAMPAAAGVPPASAPRPGVAGVLAALLPFGVGQAYNGQYTRGIVHLLIISVLVWGSGNTGSVEVFFGLGIAAFYFYQIIDAVRSAQHLAAGQPAPDPLGLDSLLGRRWTTPPSPVASPTSAVPLVTSFTAVSVSASPDTTASNVPTAAIVLIGLGLIFLLGHSGVHVFWIGRIWPLIFLAIGAALLVKNWESITLRHTCLMAPAVMLTLGVLFMVQSVGHVRFGRSFPLLLIVIGAVLIWQRTAAAPRPETPSPPANGGPIPAADSSDRQVGSESQGKGN
jgi:hypothetical protein